MVFWVSAFLDFAADDFEAGSSFWSAATGYAVSPARGAAGEFATLVPPDGDDFLRVQRLADGPSRIHLDLHVADPAAEAGRAVGLGAVVVARPDPGYVVLRSPGGLTFCFVGHPASRRPLPSAWPGGHRSLFDQVCLDIPAGIFDAECAFWAELTGWPRRESMTAAEFHYLERPPAIAVRLLLQRLDDVHGEVGAHPDIACSDRPAETSRHLALGAEVVRVYPRWTVLRSPVGTPYCLTDRRPETDVV